MKNIFLLCFFVLCGLCSYASEHNTVNDCVISGVVLDALTGKPVADVLVTAQCNQCTGELRATSDEFGQFKLQGLPAGSYTVKFKKGQYRPLEKKNLTIKRGSSKLNAELVQEDAVREYHLNWLLKTELM